MGPVSVAIDASIDSFRFYKDGVYTERWCSSTSLDHAVLAVGYGNDPAARTPNHPGDYWLMKNSWGADWGDEGYIKIRRNHDNMCGVATSASIPLV